MTKLKILAALLLIALPAMAQRYPGTTGVTSVDMTVPPFLSVVGGPITSDGTLVVDLSGAPITMANGSYSAPIYSFSNAPDTGFYLSSTSPKTVSLAVNGSPSVDFRAGYITPSTSGVALGSSAKPFNLGYFDTGILLRNRAPLYFFDSANGSSLSFKAPASVASDVSWTLPGTDGTNGQILKTNGAGILSWVTPNPGTVISIDVSGGTTGLTTSGGPVSSVGTITLGGTLGIANGGTGQTTRQAAINGLTGAVTSGQYLRGDGTNVVMSAIQAADVPILNQNTTGTASNVTGVVAITNGGTGQTTQQGALNAIAGATTAGQFLRGDGTNVSMSAIQASDVPTLNQNTTGTASNVTGTVAIANGGTGQTTANAAFNALAPSQTSNSGKYLTTDGTNTSWATVSTGIDWSTPVNSNITPDTNNTRNIGTTGNIFQSVFAGSIKNSSGDPVLSSNDLCLTTGGSSILCWTSNSVISNKDFLVGAGGKALGSTTTKWGSLYLDSLYDKVNASGSNGQVLTADGAGKFSWTTPSSGITWSTPVDANIVPSTATTYSLGSSAKPFLFMYGLQLRNSDDSVSISVNGRCLRDTANNDVFCWGGENYTTKDLYSSNTNNLGKSTAKWASLYADTIYDKNNVSGSANQVLTADGTGKFTWSTPSAASGTVTSVAVSGGTTGLTTTGSPITTSGTITLGGTLAVANGGSGQTTAQGAMNTFAGATTSGQYLRGNGTNVVMSAIQAADVPILNQNTTGTASNVTGVVALANGGTGATTQAGAANAVLPTQTSNSGKFLKTDGTNVSWATVAASPGGTNAQLQYNNLGAFGGTSGASYNSTLNALSLDGAGSTSVSAQVGYDGFLNSYGSSMYITNDIYLTSGTWNRVNSYPATVLDLNSSGDFTIHKVAATGGVTLNEAFRIDSSKNYYFKDASLGSAAVNYVWTLQNTATGQGAWKAVSAAGTVTSVNVSGGTTGLTFSGGPITTSGTITTAGTLAIANGGTGATTATAAFNALAPSQTSNSGKYLTTDGTNTSWGTVTAFPATSFKYLGSATSRTIVAGDSVILMCSGTSCPDGFYAWDFNYNPGGTSRVNLTLGATNAESLENLVYDINKNRSALLRAQLSPDKTTVLFYAGTVSNTLNGIRTYNNGAGVGGFFTSIANSSSGNGTPFNTGTTLTAAWPSNEGTMGQVLATNGAGSTYWTSLMANVNYPTLGPVGSATAPTYSFVGYPTTGMYMSATSPAELSFTTGGASRLKMNSSGVYPGANNSFSFGSTTAYWADAYADVWKANSTGFQAYSTGWGANMAVFKDAITSPSAVTMVGLRRNTGAGTQAIGISGGDDAASASALGDLLIEGQNNTSSGAGGAVKIRGGTSASGNGGGIVFKTPGTKPTCSSTVRGMYWHTLGGAGVADTVEVCTKDAADAYGWRALF